MPPDLTALDVHIHALASPLTEAMSTALARTHSRLAGLYHSDYPSVRPMVLRCDLREYLTANPLPGPWVVAGNSKLSGQLILEAAALGIRLRFLKERRGTVPAAGHTKARNRAWNQPLPLDWPSSPAVGTGLLEMLLLWDYRNSDLDGFTLRAVRTAGAGSFHRPVPVDHAVRLEVRSPLHESARFEGAEDDIDLFAPVQLDEEAGGEA